MYNPLLQLTPENSGASAEACEIAARLFALDGMQSIVQQEWFQVVNRLPCIPYDLETVTEVWLDAWREARNSLESEISAIA